MYAEGSLNKVIKTKEREPKIVTVDTYNTVRYGELEVFNILIPEDYQEFDAGNIKFWHPPINDTKRPIVYYERGSARYPSKAEIINQKDEKAIKLRITIALNKVYEKLPRTKTLKILPYRSYINRIKFYDELKTIVTGWLLTSRPTIMIMKGEHGSFGLHSWGSYTYVYVIPRDVLEMLEEYLNDLVTAIDEEWRRPPNPKWLMKNVMKAVKPLNGRRYRTYIYGNCCPNSDQQEYYEVYVVPPHTMPILENHYSRYSNKWSTYFWRESLSIPYPGRYRMMAI